MLQADGNNFVRFDWDGDGTNVHLYVAIWSGGPAFRPRYDSPVGNNGVQWMRVEKNGTTYTVYTSINGSSWKQRVQFTWTPAPALLGLAAGSSNTSTAYTARFDYLHLLAVGG